jgi:membrane protease YdiL (CAAX protease family)
MIIINIRFIRQQDAEMREIYSSDFLDVSKDYYRYNFNIKSFKVLKGLKYAVQTYAVTISINIIVTLIISLLKLNLEQQEIVTELQKVPLNRFVYMIPIMVIFAPIVEEFTFRWLFYAKVFKPRLGVYGAALLSSILFSLVHFNIRVFPVLIAIGLINCYLVEKKGYWYAVFNHLVFNSISVVAMIIQNIN